MDLPRLPQIIPNFGPQVGSVMRAGVLVFKTPGFLDILLGRDTSPPLKHDPFRDCERRNDWGIADLGTRNYAFTFDSCIAVEFERSSKVSDFPIERGAFGSYNKVSNPATIKVQLSVACYGDGTDSLRVSELLSQLKSAVQSPTLYRVITPDAFYDDYTVESFSFRRSADKGHSLVIAEVELREVRQVEPRTATVALPTPKAPKKVSAESKVKEGEKKVTVLTGPQLAVATGSPAAAAALGAASRSRNPANVVLGAGALKPQ